ncbi:hypothetical protein GF325_14390 [Candidatus Bathyarchaeota archaeon]|nr:hypothetical protein [Candidatus Bathyarchaeota archaeon]
MSELPRREGSGFIDRYHVAALISSGISMTPPSTTQYRKSTTGCFAGSLVMDGTCRTHAGSLP